MQDGFEKPKLHIIKYKNHQNEQPEGLQNRITYPEQTKGHSIIIDENIEMVTTPTLCRDCKHTINQSSQCYLMLCKAVQLLRLFSLIANMSRGNLLHDCLGTAIHNCSSSGSLFFATLRQNN